MLLAVVSSLVFLLGVLWLMILPISVIILVLILLGHEMMSWTNISLVLLAILLVIIGTLSVSSIIMYLQTVLCRLILKYLVSMVVPESLKLNKFRDVAIPTNRDYFTRFQPSSREGCFTGDELCGDSRKIDTLKSISELDSQKFFEESQSTD